MTTPPAWDQRAERPTRLAVALAVGAVVAVLAAQAVLVLGWLRVLAASSSRFGLFTILLPALVPLAAELLVWRGRTVAARAAAWTLFGGVVLVLAPLVWSGYVGALWMLTGFSDTSDWEFTVLVCGRALLSLVYAVMLGVRLSGRGGGRVGTTVRLGALVLLVLLTLLPST